MIVTVQHVNAVARVDDQSPRLVELARIESGASPTGDPFALGVKALDPLVLVFDDQNGAITRDGQVIGVEKFALSFALAAPNVDQFGRGLAEIVSLDTVIAGVECLKCSARGCADPTRNSNCFEREH